MKTPPPPTAAFKKQERRDHVKMGRDIYSHYQLDFGISDESLLMNSIILLLSDILEAIDDGD